jgi:hypothetical protein
MFNWNWGKGEEQKEGTVQAYEYNGQLYRTEKEVEDAKQRDRLESMRANLVDVLYRYDIILHREFRDGTKFNYNKLADALIANWPDISKDLGELNDK